QRDDAHRTGGVRRLDDAPTADIYRDVRDRPRRRVGGEEDEVAWPQRSLRHRATYLCLLFGRAGQQDAERVIDAVGQPGAIEAEAGCTGPQVADAQKLFRGAYEFLAAGSRRRDARRENRQRRASDRRAAPRRRLHEGPGPTVPEGGRFGVEAELQRASPRGPRGRELAQPCRALGDERTRRWGNGRRHWARLGRARRGGGRGWSRGRAPAIARAGRCA